MKKNYSLLSVPSLFLAVSAIVIAVSCNKVDNDIKPANLPRQFTPGDINVNRTQTSATLSWSHVFSTPATTYTFQLSTDSTFSGTPLVDQVIDTNNIVLTDSILQPRQIYFARVKANAIGSSSESRWVNSSRFSITGEQIFYTVLDADIKDTSVLLKWTHAEGLTRIVVTPAVGTPFTVTLSAADVAADQKKINGLKPTTLYTAEIYKGSLLKGTISFTTKEKSIYAAILNPGDDLGAAIDAAANGDLIGLMDGTYDLGASSSGFSIDGKRIAIASVSGSASKVTILNSDFVLKGTAPGIKLSGLTLTGPQNGYIVDVNASASDIGNIVIQNCKLGFDPSGYAVVRANRGSGQTMDSLIITGTTGIGLNLNNNYAVAMLDKMKFNAVVIKNSTFSSFKRAIVSAATAISGWSASVTIDHSTFNNFGGGGKTAVLDASSNNIALTITNSLFANTPLSGETVRNEAITSGGTNDLQKVFYYNTNNGASPAVPLTWPAGATATTEISWTETTTDFTLPAGSSLRTAGTNNSPVGDPRWAQ
jgi:hypothetical protein